MLYLYEYGRSSYIRGCALCETLERIDNNNRVPRVLSLLHFIPLGIAMSVYTLSTPCAYVSIQEKMPNLSGLYVSLIFWLMEMHCLGSRLLCTHTSGVVYCHDHQRYIHLYIYHSCCTDQ